MTSERRAYIIIIVLTLAGMCFYGQNVTHWTLQTVFGIIGAGATAFIAGVTKSPRDGALSDLATPPVVEVQQATDTTVTTHAEAAAADAKPAP